MTTLVTLIVWLLVIGVLWWAVNTATGLLGVSAPIAKIIQVVFILVVVLLLFSVLFGGAGLPRLSL